MVQKEIKKKTRIYGAIAVLSAIILVAAIYTLSSPTVVLTPLTNVSPLKTFTSLDALKSYLDANSQVYSYSGGPLDSEYFGSATPTASPSASSSSPSVSNSEPAPNNPSSSSAQTNSAGSTYSTTNVQVAGVDEPDTVKTDGNYIYTLSTSQYSGLSIPATYMTGTTGSTNAVYVVNADPQNPSVVAKINLDNNTEPAGLFLSQDGSKLVVIASEYQPIFYGGAPIPGTASGTAVPLLPAYDSNVYTFIEVYDVSNPANPVLTTNYTISGSYFDSRMIGNYVYAVISQPAYDDNGTVVLPIFYENAVSSTVMPTDIYYTSTNDTYFTYTTFVALNVMDDSQAPSIMTIMMGGTSVMYVSQSNMYVTFPTPDGQDTAIYRVSINGQTLAFQAEGTVPGYVLNQYSMDEYNGYFRIATTTSTDSGFSETQQSNLYVLDMNLTVVGKLENLAQGESIYAARFMGDTCYLVTYHQTDPFFVIDLSNPQAPTVAGELQIPGYSSYLYPYDANHVIGLGQITTIVNGVENHDLMLSLFDVTNLNNPVEIANYTVAGNETSSTALYDPHAFLFDPQNQLLVIPVSITNYEEETPLPISQSTVPTPIPAQGNATSGASTISSPPVISPPIIILNNENWQGAYVFNVHLTNGFTLKGTVTNLNETLLNSQGFIDEYNWNNYNSQNDVITRSLYIGNTLYTISNSEIQLTDLTDMTQIAIVYLT